MSISWRNQAFCQGANPEIFDDPESVETAKAYCTLCPVSIQCLAWSLTFDSFGVWGGTTEDERRMIRRGHLPSDPSCPGCGGRSTFNDGHTEICLSCDYSW